MVTRSICVSCRRTLLAQWRLSRQPSSVKWDALRPSTTLQARQLSTLPSRLKQSPPAQPYQSKRPPTQAKEQDPVKEEKGAVAPSDAVYERPPTAAQSVARSLREHLPKTTETYVAYGACERLMKECARQAAYKVPQAAEKGGVIPKTEDGQELGIGQGWWYDTLRLPPTFNTWAQVTLLHMYILTVRFRCFPPSHVRVWHQHLYDQFSTMAEDKMIADHKLDMRALRTKYLKMLFEQWRGMQAGYDEGLVRGDAVLATAVWRNIFQANPDVDFRGVGEVVSYIRHSLFTLQDFSDDEIASGELAFETNPGSERTGVLVRSRMMDSARQGADISSHRKIDKS